MNTAAVRANWIDQVIDGRFTLLQWLGSSASRDVFLTELQGPGSQKVAIKITQADADGPNAYLSRWQVATTLSIPTWSACFTSDAVRSIPPSDFTP